MNDNEFANLIVGGLKRICKGYEESLKEEMNHISTLTDDESSKEVKEKPECDCISRQDAIDEMFKHFNIDTSKNIRDVLETQSPVRPTIGEARWVDVQYDSETMVNDDRVVKIRVKSVCDHCFTELKYFRFVDSVSFSFAKSPSAFAIKYMLYPYCPACGYKMLNGELWMFNTERRTNHDK